ncbi:hypothetical protein GCM10008097_06560 [Mycetocola manganoxydans]|nr:hypothetical protein GCM10008097_06560 [Mycetocola manganoxydans]
MGYGGMKTIRGRWATPPRLWRELVGDAQQVPGFQNGVLRLLNATADVLHLLSQRGGGGLIGEGVAQLS